MSKILNEEQYYSIGQMVQYFNTSDEESLLSYLKDDDKRLFDESACRNDALDIFNGDMIELLNFVDKNSTTKKSAVGNAKFMIEGQFEIEIENDITDKDDIDIPNYITNEMDLSEDVDTFYDSGSVEYITTAFTLISFEDYIKKNEQKKSA